MRELAPEPSYLALNHQTGPLPSRDTPPTALRGMGWGWAAGRTASGDMYLFLGCCDDRFETAELLVVHGFRVSHGATGCCFPRL